MKPLDLFKLCLSEIAFLDEKKKVFLQDLKKRSIKEGRLTLTGAQYQYLLSCYDQMISKKYGVEPMSTDKEYAALRAIRVARRRKP